LPPPPVDLCRRFLFAMLAKSESAEVHQDGSRQESAFRKLSYARARASGKISSALICFRPGVMVISPCVPVRTNRGCGAKTAGTGRAMQSKLVIRLSAAQSPAFNVSDSDGRRAQQVKRGTTSRASRYRGERLP